MKPGIKITILFSRMKLQFFPDQLSSTHYRGTLKDGIYGITTVISDQREFVERA
jgi:hypothetical protein